MRQLLANVFQARIETIQVANSAALGAAMRAANAVGGVPFADLAARFCAVTGATEPQPGTRDTAAARLRDFAAFEAAQTL